MAAMARLSRILRTNTISFRSKFKLCKFLVTSILYSCEQWPWALTLRKDEGFWNQVSEETSPHLLRQQMVSSCHSCANNIYKKRDPVHVGVVALLTGSYLIPVAPWSRSQFPAQHQSETSLTVHCASRLVRLEILFWGRVEDDLVWFDFPCCWFGFVNCWIWFTCLQWHFWFKDMTQCLLTKIQLSHSRL